MEDNKFNKKEYIRNYQKTHYVKYSYNVRSNEIKVLEEYRTQHNMTISEFVRAALFYYIDHN